MIVLEEGSRREEPVFGAPAVVVALLGLFVVVYGVTALLPQAALNSVIVSFGFIPAELSVIKAEELSWSIGTAGRFTPLITYAFLHGDLTHLAMNGIWFLAFATPVARRMGSWPMLAFFFVCSILAALAYWMVNADSIIPMVGASGGISGLMGAAFRFMFLDPQGHKGRRGGSLPLLSRQILVLALVWSVLNIVMGVWGGALSGADANQMIAWEAHLGGFFAGLILFRLFDWRLPPPRPAIQISDLIR